jgi:DNA-binding XRE family transcriptional regulator
MPSLRQIRRNQLLSQRDLARKARITPSTVYLIEAGRTRPRLKVMRQICEALSVAPTDVDEFRHELEGDDSLSDQRQVS